MASVSWIATVWTMVAAACLTLAAIHAQVWLQRRAARANAAFALLAASVAAIAYVELRMLHATTIDAYGRWLWWYQLPLWSGVLAVVWFARLYLRAGRAWLGWSAVGLRTLALAINFGASPSIHFRRITALERVPLLGDSMTAVQGVANPWLAVNHASLLMLAAFVASASRVPSSRPQVLPRSRLIAYWAVEFATQLEIQAVAQSPPVRYSSVSIIT